MTVFIHGQKAVTGAAQQISASTIKPVTLLIKAHADNLQDVFIGDSDVTTSGDETGGWSLSAGEEFRFDEAHGPLRKMPNLNEVYVIGTTNNNISWMATPR